jgi:hypothetical protein
MGKIVLVVIIIIIVLTAMFFTARQMEKSRVERCFYETAKKNCFGFNVIELTYEDYTCKFVPCKPPCLNNGTEQHNFTAEEIQSCESK